METAAEIVHQGNSFPTTDESLESTRRMKEIMINCQETGGKTMQMLYYQGEQLERIGDANNEIRENVREAHKHLSQMERCCGLFSGACFKQFICCVSKSKATKTDTDKDFYRKPAKEKRSSTTTAGKSGYSTGSNNNVQNGAQITDGYISRITNDAREEEMDENLGEVSAALGQLRTLALDMGQEVKRQDDLIDRNVIKTQINSDEVNSARVRTEKLRK